MARLHSIWCVRVSLHSRESDPQVHAPMQHTLRFDTQENAWSVRYERRVVVRPVWCMTTTYWPTCLHERTSTPQSSKQVLRDTRLVPTYTFSTTTYIITLPSSIEQTRKNRDGWVGHHLVTSLVAHPMFQKAQDPVSAGSEECRMPNAVQRAAHVLPIYAGMPTLTNTLLGPMGRRIGQLDSVRCHVYVCLFKSLSGTDAFKRPVMHVAIGEVFRALGPRG